MRGPTDQLDRFLQAVHRRRVAWRVVESAGLGIAIGAIAGASLAGVMLWRQLDGAGIAMSAIALGAIAGVLHGFVRHPTLLDTTSEADRQLKLHDLLATALTMRASTDPWAKLVVMQAHRRAASLRPGDVLLQRFGARAWSGIGLVSAIALVLSAMTVKPGDAMATGEQNRTSGFTGVSVDDDLQQARGERTSTRPPGGAQSVDRSIDPSSDPANASAVRGGREATGNTSDGSGMGMSTSTDPASANPADNAPGQAPDLTDANASRIARGSGQPQVVLSDGTGVSSNDRVSPGIIKPSGTVRSDGREIAPSSGVPVPLEAIPSMYRDVAKFYFDANR